MPHPIVHASISTKHVWSPIRLDMKEGGYKEVSIILHLAARAPALSGTFGAKVPRACNLQATYRLFRHLFELPA